MYPQHRLTPGFAPASCPCLVHRRPEHRDIPWRFAQPAPTLADHLVYAGDRCLAWLGLAAQVAAGWLAGHHAALRYRLGLVVNLSGAYALLAVHWLAALLVRRLELRQARSMPSLLPEGLSLPVVVTFACAAILIVLLGWLQII